MNFHPFIEQFPARRQSFIESLFTYAVRGDLGLRLNGYEPTMDVKEILRRVEREAQDRIDLEHFTAEMKDDCAELIEQLAMPEANEYAKFVIDKERDRLELRERVYGQAKEANKQRFINKALSNKPPTAKQIAYLEALGYRGSVAELSMAEVSGLINQYKNK